MQPIRKERGESHSSTWIPVSPPRSTPRLKSALWRQRLPSAQRLRTEFLKRVAHRPTREERGESRSAACSCAAQSETRLGGWVPRFEKERAGEKQEAKSGLFVRQSNDTSNGPGQWTTHHEQGRRALTSGQWSERRQ